MTVNTPDESKLNALMNLKIGGDFGPSYVKFKMGVDYRQALRVLKLGVETGVLAPARHAHRYRMVVKNEKT